MTNKDHDSPPRKPPHKSNGCGGDRLKRDEWSDGAVSSLLEAYEAKWVLGNRAKLKDHDWKDVAKHVTSRANSSKSPKTKTQCRNNMESMRKRYRSESATADDVSTWPLYPRLDLLYCGSAAPPLLVAPVGDSPCSSIPINRQNSIDSNDVDHRQNKKRSFEHLKIPLKEIQLATNGFHADHLIGRGGFGGVYKAELFHLDVRKYVKMNDSHGQSTVEVSTYPRIKSTVAVKKLDIRYGQGREQFLREIKVLSVLNHQNIVSLLGFCDEDGEMILIYEHASNGSLDRHIGKIQDVYSYTWAQRLQICLDVAHGLNYLHEMDIIHRDIKSANILIGDTQEAMIGDFGLSRIKKNTNVEYSITDVAGTLAYVEPKYARTGMLTKKSDIYSFGVVLLEVFCGRLAVLPRLGDDPEYLLHQAERHFQQKTFIQMIDPYLNEEFEKNCAISGNTSFSDSINTFTEITYKCLHNDQAHHLAMADVVQELKKAWTMYHKKGWKELIKLDILENFFSYLLCVFEVLFSEKPSFKL